MRDGLRCVVANIDFCKSESRAEAENVLRAAVPNVEICWCFFAHDERACEENIKRRNRGSLEADIRELRRYSRVYSIPRGADVRPVTGEKP